jgi:L-alanine-DL-glutamate epimerase-like enolase superfamily enzyme
MDELHAFTAFNSTVKSAFDMALYDLAAKEAGLPLYAYLQGERKLLETDLTIGLGEPETMAATAAEYKNRGVRIIKIKLGKDGREDVERVKQIREAVGDSIELRVDANQGWDFDTACEILQAIAGYGIQFCEQPMRRWNDHLLPQLKAVSPVKIMADESVFDHHDAERLIRAGACDFINIKLAKSGGIREALEICRVCSDYRIPCMMGGMLESRLALTAFAHFAASQEVIRFYDMDTCLLGHKTDPVTGGIRYRDYLLELPEAPGIGADMEEGFLNACEQVCV